MFGVETGHIKSNNIYKSKYQHLNTVNPKIIFRIIVLSSKLLFLCSLKTN